MSKKSSHGRSDGKKAHGKSHGHPQAGLAGPGASIEPSIVPEESASEQALRREPREAGAPGVPVSQEEYERLKEEAKGVRRWQSRNVQVDPAQKKPKK